jgi:hypothetical protein
MSEHRPEEGARLEQEDAQRYPEHDDPDAQRQQAGLDDETSDDDDG